MLVRALALVLLLASSAFAQVTPGANFPLTGCTDGAPVLWVNGGESCISVASPSVSSCGVSPSVYGSDFAGVIGVGTGLVTTCVATCGVTFGGTYTAPLRCVVASSLASVGLGQSTTAQALTLAMSVSLGGGGITYHCRP